MNGAEGPDASPGDERAVAAAEARADRDREAAAQAASSPAAKTAAEEPAAQAVPDLGLAEISKLLVELADLAVRSLVDPKLGLEAGEKQLIAAQTVPVLAKYLPTALHQIGPEWALFGTVAMIYGAKMMAPPSAAPPPPAGEVVDSTATETKAAA